MQSTDFWIGVIVLVLGAINLLIHIIKPTLFRKLTAMREKFGDKAGFIIHFIAYVILPVVVGIILILTSK